MDVYTKYYAPQPINWSEDATPLLLIAMSVGVPLILKAKDTFTHSKK
jgi:TRAP-type C4-dicarboxylate transport system permease small subunit